MLAKRIIPCLDCDLSVAQGRVVKGVQFKEIKYAGVPWEQAEAYYAQGADEIVFLDITASSERRETMVDVIKKTAQEVFVPLTVGGGIRSLADAKNVFEAGADKVSINTAALERPTLISEIAKAYGNQAVVLAIDAKKREEKGKVWWECSKYGGRTFTGKDCIEWVKEAVALGAGEILLTSMDRDGTKEGFDLELTKAVSESVNVPVIASGGGGNLESFVDVFEKGKADAALAASIFHFNEFPVWKVKAYLKEKGIVVRE